MSLLKCIGLVKDYPGKRAVDGVDFSLQAGCNSIGVSLFGSANVCSGTPTIVAAWSAWHKSASM